MATSTAELGVWEYDLETQRAIWDNGTRKLFSADDSEELIPDDLWEKSLHPDDRQYTIFFCRIAIMTKKDFAIDYRIVRPCGEVRHLRCRAGYCHDDVNGGRVIGVVWDITDDIRQAEELRAAKELAENNSQKIQAVQSRLEYNALHDALTGLPNRRHLDNALERLSEHEGGLRNRRIAALHIDLDRFKQINDTLGHAAGDTVLKAAAGILDADIQGKALVSRTGGDEFVILFDDAPSDAELANLAGRLIKRLREPVIFEGHECLYGASIGIATAWHGEALGRTLLVNSDIALYRAKNEGRNRFSFFTVDMQEQVIAHKMFG
jgi:diguanylate cyclase (GGDEF)-like protein